MRSRKLAGVTIALVILVTAFNNCTRFASLLPAAGLANQPSSAGLPSAGSSSAGGVDNAMTVTVGNLDILNEPTVSVTICVPGTSNCTTVDDILLDTGSQGLRIFAASLPSAFVGALPTAIYGECLSYVGGQIDWGAVSHADIQLGRQIAPNVPIQVVDSNYGDQGKSCYASTVQLAHQAGLLSSTTACAWNSANNSAACPTLDHLSAHFNGILGVNFVAQDCGASCAGASNAASFTKYYRCAGASCAVATAALTDQVQNPVGFLPNDNNGVILSLPAVDASGVSSTSLYGQLIFGIGTRADNTLDRVTTLTASATPTDSCYADFHTNWQNQTMCGYIDSGTTLMNFPMPSNSSVLPTDEYGDYIPNQAQTFSAVNVGLNGASSTVQFTIADPSRYFSAQGEALVPVIATFGVNSSSGTSGEGSTFLSGDFVWGTPFFFGRIVAIGLEGKSSNLGTGLYWSYSN